MCSITSQWTELMVQTVPTYCMLPVVCSEPIYRNVTYAYFFLRIFWPKVFRYVVWEREWMDWDDFGVRVISLALTLFHGAIIYVQNKLNQHWINFMRRLGDGGDQWDTVNNETAWIILIFLVYLKSTFQKYSKLSKIFTMSHSSQCPNVDHLPLLNFRSVP